MSSIRVLLTAPLRQERMIFECFQDSLDALEIPGGVQLDRFFVVNDCEKVKPLIRGAEYVTVNTGDLYIKTVNDHVWTAENLNKMPELRNMTIQRALDGGYDYWWSVDTDLVLQPETLRELLSAGKDIVSEVFWTQAPSGRWWCNAWMFDQADADGHLDEWRVPGLYQVGMTGACTLVKTDVFRHNVSYSEIPNIRKVLWGEDRWFCIRAACAGYEMWLDTHFPAEHLFTEAVYQKWRETHAGE